MAVQSENGLQEKPDVIYVLATPGRPVFRCPFRDEKLLCELVAGDAEHIGDFRGGTGQGDFRVIRSMLRFGTSGGMIVQAEDVLDRKPFVLYAITLTTRPVFPCAERDQ